MTHEQSHRKGQIIMSNQNTKNALSEAMQKVVVEFDHDKPDELTFIFTFDLSSLSGRDGHIVSKKVYTGGSMTKERPFALIVELAKSRVLDAMEEDGLVPLSGAG